MNKNRLLKKRIKTLKVEQKEVFDEMQKDPLLTLCYPCGFGKGYIIGTDMMKQVIDNDDARILALLSHRIGLNDQHVSDIFDQFLPLIGSVAFAFLGSSGGLNINRLVRENNYKVLRTIDAYHVKNPTAPRIAPANLTITTTKLDKLIQFINLHHDKKVIIVSTYHSAHLLSDPRIQLHTMYCDEAHELASDFKETYSERSFINNYNKIHCQRKFFFSATPKDCSDDPLNSYLMNNVEIFGRRLEMSHLEAVNKGYVVSIVIDFLRPSTYNAEHNQDHGTIINKARFILEAFAYHREWLRTKSSRPELIAPKLLIRCSSVEKDMWPIYNALLNMAGDIKIFASASNDSDGSNTKGNLISINGEHVEFDKEIEAFVPWRKSIDRKEYIETIQGLSDTDEAIVLHHDTISEGLNVPGFTCFMPFSDKLITTTKLYQNLGRVIRLNKIDKKLLTDSKLEVDGEGWIKPKAHMIIPYWSLISGAAAINMSRVIKNLETNTGARTGTEIPFGDDIATGYNRNDEGSSRKRSDNRNESLEGVTFENYFERQSVDLSVMIENQKGLNPIERLRYLRQIRNERNN